MTAVREGESVCICRDSDVQFNIRATTGLNMEECIPCEFVKGSLYRHRRGLCVVMVESLPRAPMNSVIYGHYKSLVNR